MKINVFDERLDACGVGPLSANGFEILQVNVGLRCNQSCAHCHLSASPGRTEVMSAEVMGHVLRVAERTRPRLVDITGGAPELHPGIREFIAGLDSDGHAVQVRTNLTVLRDTSCADLPELFRRHRVRLVGSLPCYLEENVDRQRGLGVYRSSIETLRHLNRIGYGCTPELPLDLVYNPGGFGLPPDQQGLETDYRRELRARHGIEFTRLLTLTNAPLGGFHDQLSKEGRDAPYRQLLHDAFNPCTVERLMCRSQIEVAWDGRLYDCDFNVALDLPVGLAGADHVSRFDAAALAVRRIVTGAHCFVCTAGGGSSCRGALTAA